MRLGYGILFASSLPGSSRNPRNLPFRDHRLGNLCLPQFPFATDGVSMAKDPFSGRLPGSGREDDGEQPGGCGPWPADWCDGGGDALVAEADAGRCEVPFGGEDAGDLGPEAFAPGGLAEGMGPGPVLAGLVHAAAGADGAGLDALSEDQLLAVVAAARRLEARAVWAQLAAMAVFAARRRAGPGAARDLVAAAARDPRTRWCVTALRGDGTAAAHGCAGPAPPAAAGAAGGGVPGRPRDQVQAGDPRPVRPRPGRARVPARPEPGAPDPGAHRPLPGAGLRPARGPLRPGPHGRLAGRRPHLPCNLAPLCRHHHRLKQAEGWSLTQPEPGVMIWRTPAGRTYVTTPTAYPV